MFDRKLTGYVLDLRSSLPRSIFDGTVIDAEAVVSKLGRLSILCFDCISMSGHNVGDLPFSERISFLRNALYTYRPDPGDTATFEIKRFFNVLGQFNNFLEHYFEASEKWAVDGAIFTPENDPVVNGRHIRMFKWKAIEHHTIDFVLGRNSTLSVFDRGSLKQVGHLNQTPATRGLEVGAIIECSLSEDSTWDFIRVREDKNTSNDLRTFRATLDTIRDGLTFRKLVTHFLDLQSSAVPK
jgi:hypothetical protein